jgi:hypothetical protein
MRLKPKNNGFGGRHRQPEAAFVGGLWEVLIAFVIVAMAFGSIVGGYISGATKAQWSGYSLAAQTLAGQTLEQARSAKFDCSSIGTNRYGGMEIIGMNLINKSLVTTSTNWTMTGYNTNILDVPWTSTNYVVATNFISVRLLFANGITNPWIQMQMIRVDTVWPFNGWGGFTPRAYTNTVCTMLAPDNRDPISLGVSP